MLYKSINAFRYPFAFSTVVYSDKPKAEPTSYYTPGTTQTVKYLIQNLECHTNLVARSILYDRLYTSIPMALWLLDRGKTSVGTLQSNRKTIPAEIREIKDRETNSYEIYWEKNNVILNLHSYVVKAKSEQCHRYLQLHTKDDNKSKPAIYKLYDFSKGETDIIDQKNGVLQLYIEIKELDYECILIRFEHMSSERQHDICNEQRSAASKHKICRFRI